MKRACVILVILVANLFFAATLSAARISIWDMETYDTFVNGLGYITPDEIDSNTGYNMGAPASPGYHGDFASRQRNSWDMFRGSTNGFSLAEGTYMFWYNYGSYSNYNWTMIFSSHLAKVGSSSWQDILAVRVNFEAGTETQAILYILGGGISSGAVDTTALCELLDGQWHNIAFTYKDGEPVKIYFDGEFLVASSDPYVASNWYDNGIFGVGGLADKRDCWDYLGVNGLYDYVLYEDKALSAEEIQFYIENGYIPEPASIGLLLLGLGLVRRR